MSSHDKLIEVLKMIRDRGLTTALPPQFQSSQAVNQLIEMISQTRKQHPESINEGDFLLRLLETHKKILLGDVDEQIKLSLMILAKTPQNPDAWCHLATMFKAKGNPLAIVFFEHALRLNPNHSDANYNYGNLMKSTGNLDKAAELYRKCIQIDPKDYNAHNNLGTVLVEQQKFDEAERCFEKVIEIFPLHPRAHFNLGNVYLHRKDFQQAEKYLRKAIELDPNYEKAKIALAALQQMKKSNPVETVNLPLQVLKVSGQARIKGNCIELGEETSGRRSSPKIGQVEIKLNDLRNFYSLKLRIEFEEAEGILYIDFLRQNNDNPISSFPIPIINEAKMTIEIPFQSIERKEDLSQAERLIFRLTSVSTFYTENYLVTISDLQLVKH